MRGLVLSLLLVVMCSASVASAREVEVSVQQHVELTGRVVLDPVGRAIDTRRRPAQAAAAGAMVHLEGPLWLGARVQFTRVSVLRDDPLALDGVSLVPALSLQHAIAFGDYALELRLAAEVGAGIGTLDEALAGTPRHRTAVWVASVLPSVGFVSPRFVGRLGCGYSHLASGYVVPGPPPPDDGSFQAFPPPVLYAPRRIRADGLVLTVSLAVRFP